MYKTKINVLIIDDDTIYQYVSRKTLEATGHTSKIHICSNGEEACIFLENNMFNFNDLPDVILLDINMPIMNGWEFLESYKLMKPKFSKDIQLFIVTSSINDQDKEYGKRFSCVQDYIVKPLAKDKILEIFSVAVPV